MSISVWRAAFAAASIAWTLLLPLAPYVATRPHASAFTTVVVFAVYSVGHLICHQLPERSFRLWGAQLPVCARCTGIYVGAAVAAIVASARLGPQPTKPAWWPGHRFSDARAATVRAILALAALPTVLTLVYEWTTGHTPSNVVRAAAGGPIGVAVGWVVVHAIGTGSTAENQVN